jgi:cobalt-zinc-cadmium efflux system membrane fusion protein
MISIRNLNGYILDVTEIFRRCEVVMVLSLPEQRKRQHVKTLLTAMVPLLIQGCVQSTSAPAPDINKTGSTKTSTAADDKGDVTATPNSAAGNPMVTLTPDAERDADVAFATAEPRVLETDVTLTGEVLANANTQIHVTTPVVGRITKILVSIGAYVRPGEKLLMVRSTDIQQAESDLLTGEQQVRSDLKQSLVQIDCDSATADAQLKLDEKIYTRQKGLYEEKIAAQADFQMAETLYLKDKIAVESLAKKRKATVDLSTEKMKLVTGPAKSKLRLLGVTDAEIETVMKTQVVDPMDSVDATGEGVVVERLVNVGELVDPSKPLFTIGDFHTVWLKADVFEKDISKVKLGQPIELLVDSFPDRVFKGRLDYVANQVDSDTRTLAVRAEVANQDLLLKPKMFARMKIIVDKDRALAIPTAAVQDTRTSKVVYVPKGNNSYEERTVKLGEQSGDYVEILQGLKDGEKVVTKGSFDLRANSVRMHSS